MLKNFSVFEVVQKVFVKLCDISAFVVLDLFLSHIQNLFTTKSLSSLRDTKKYLLFGRPLIRNEMKSSFRTNSLFEIFQKKNNVIFFCSIVFLFILEPNRILSQQSHPHQFFIKLKEFTTGESSIQYSTSGKTSFTDPTLSAKAIYWHVKNLQPLIPQSEKKLSKGYNELHSIIVVTIDSINSVDDVMKDFASNPGVEYVEHNNVYRLDFVPNDSAYASQWGTQRVGMEKAWDITKGSSSVTIGVIDTGIDYNHNDLKTQLWINSAEDVNRDGIFEPWLTSEVRNGLTGDFDSLDNDGNGYVDDVIGYDFTDQVGFSNAGGGDYNIPDPDPYDDFGHGTNVSGIIGAAMNNYIGVAGIAPNCKIMMLRAFDARGVGLESDVARALAYAIQMGVKVVNMSFGDKTYSRVLRDVIRYAYSIGVTMVASSGNSSSDELHYPSGYDETISVGAVGQGDGLASFSNYGESMDLVAPGIGIVTTDKDNRYSSFNGTSASAPFVTGAAALIKSLHPEFNPEEVRGIIVASADDISGKGWDHTYGAGRLNVYKALLMNQPTVVHITSPKTDFGTNQSKIVITGTVASPLMKSFSLQYGVGVKPQQWFDIIPLSNRQAVEETLAVWDISNLIDSTYIIRLSALSNKAITIEDRVTIEIDHTAPSFIARGLIPVIEGGDYGVAVGFLTDEPTLGKVWYRKKNTSESWQWISAEGNSENNLFIGTVHNFYLGSKYLQPGFEYEFYFSAINKTGLESTVNNKGSNYTETIPLPIPSSGFIKKPYNLSVSRLFAASTDFDANSYREAIINDLSANSTLRILEYRNNKFNDVTPPNLMDRYPRAVGDANYNGRKELLTSFVRRGFLHEAPTATSFPQDLIWADSTSDHFWTCAIADVNGDGKQEIIAMTSDTTVGIFSLSSSNAIQRIADLVNPTAPPLNGKNSFSAPNVAIGDFNGNGKTEMLFGDDDGDFFIYESRGGNQFEVTWISENDFEQASDFVAAGDFDGDGQKEFAIGFRSSADDIIPFWFFTIRKLNSQNKSTPLWEQALYGVEENGQFGVFSRIQSSMTAGNIDDDPADELVISTFPEMYVIDYNSATKTFSPIWYQPLVNTNCALIADFDKNGINEIGFTVSDSTVFYEKNIPYNGPPIPLALNVRYQDANSVQLNWDVSGDPPLYHLYKGSSVNDLKLFGSLQSKIASDFGLELDSTYMYAVSSYDSTKSPSESPMVFSSILHPHAQPVIDSARYLQNGQVELFVSQDMGTMIPSVTAFRLNDIINPQSVAILSQRRILLSFTEITDGDYSMATNSLRDAEGIPFDKNVQPMFTVLNEAKQNFYISRVEYIPDGKIDVYFNLDVDSTSAQNKSNYIFTPYGNVIRAVLDPANKKLIHLFLDNQQPIGALGKEYMIKVSNVKNSRGQIIVSGAGSAAGIIINKENLDDMFTYPNPYRASAGIDYIMFANLTARATIRIYTASGLFVKEVQEKDGNGGVEWYLDDTDGNKVPSGIYIYYATGKNAQGIDVDSKTGKFAIIK